MKWKDRLKFIRQNMKKNRSRVFMTVLATAIGCGFLIVLASVGFGAQKYISGQILQDRTITEISIHGKENPSEDERPEVTEKDIKILEDVENVKAVSRKQQVMNDTIIRYDEFMANVPASVVDYPSEIKSGFKLEKGRMPEAENEVIIGFHVKESLYKAPKDGEPIDGKELYNNKGEVKEEYRIEKEQSLLGEEVQLQVSQWIDGKEETKLIPLKIVGIAKEPSRDWMKDNNILISSSTLSKIEQFTGTPLGQAISPDMSEEQVNELKEGGEVKTFSEVKVIANSVENVKSISKTLKDKGYFIYSVTEELEQVNLVFALVKFGLVFIGLIALLIASIGIYNTMSMAVIERTQDIGIMKAIGGHPRMIRNIFLMESAYIGLMGAIVGAVVAYLVSFGINSALPFVIQQAFNETMEQKIELSYIPAYLTAFCVLLSIGVAMLSGLKPARRATRIDVLRALRRDI
ncbi:ABC transporter permease [Pseudalkalibacillus decolorationis]|uniref:ABC transporter permease n=1 Tax=Pseudalkalibacillus decolorationis TaxID=163879 RepID=UPI002147D532|nr:FtsX-like permease family protein [Pseudalkalibacillus decolorationis]